MSMTLFASGSRGCVDHGWLKSAHTFSFASYYNPERIHFGVLRVINDDEVAPGKGFGTHPHDNMEIITIPLEGALEHQDSMGHRSVIHAGEVQVMSAGSGVTHSEYNASKTDWVKLLQIWVLTKVEDVEPRYAQKSFDFSQKDAWVTIVESIDKAKTSLGVYQDIRFSMAHLSEGATLPYSRILPQNGMYMMVISGEIGIDDVTLCDRDAVAIKDQNEIMIRANRPSQVLVMDIPVH